MNRRLLLSLLLTGVAMGGAATVPLARAQTRPRVEVPTAPPSQSHAIVQELLAKGRIILPSQVKRGMRGVSRSVFQGTTIEEFPIEVLGVLERVQGGGDIVLIKVLGGTVVKRHSGIIAGMSGSPVYINGKLLGAIAMGWGFPREPIGGVTPIAQMIETSLPDPAHSTLARPARRPMAASRITEYRPRQPLRVAGNDIKRVVVAPHDVRFAANYDRSTLHLRPATTLMQVNGFSARVLPRLRHLFEPYGIEPIIGPASRKTGVKPPIVPGGAMGVQLVSGDMDQTAVGTITFRWGNRLLAFGHPMFGQGATSLPMASAYVHEIFPSLEQSFKLASPAGTIGALQQDTQFAIGGTLGMTADTIPMAVTLRDPKRHIDRSFKVRVIKDPILTPQLIGLVATEAVESTLGLTSDKMVRVGLNMEIDNAAPIIRTNYLYANNVVTQAALSDLGQSLAITQMNEFARGSVRSVKLEVDVEPVRKTARIKQVFANRNKIKAGETVQLSVVLEPTANPRETITRTFEITVPADAPSGALRIGVGTGVDYWPLQVRTGGAPPQITGLRELVDAWGRVGSFNELLVQSSTSRAYMRVDERKIDDPAPSFVRLMRGSSTASTGLYNQTESQKVTTEFSLSGAQLLSIPVEGLRHRSRGPVAPAPAAAGSTPPKETSEGDAGPRKAPAPPPTTPAMNDGLGDADDIMGLAPGRWLESSGFAGDASATQKLFVPTTAPFLQQVATWRQAERLALSGAAPQADLPPPGSKTPPRREKPEPPIVQTGAVPAPTVTPAPTATPAPTPTPTPTVSGKLLARPALSWTQLGAGDFMGGDFDQTLVDNQGQIRLAPSIKLLATTAETFTWSIAGDGQGNVYLGTGSSARIIRVANDGKQSLFFDGDEIAVTALTTDAAGNVYAGVTPGGRVYRFTPDGRRTTLFDTGQNFVWALDWDNEGRLLIATGGAAGRLYRLADAATQGAPTNSGTIATQEIARVPQKHMRSLAVSGAVIYAGTGDEGVLYRIDSATGVTTALFQAADDGGKTGLDAEILALVAAPEGVYFGTSRSGTIFRWSAAEGVVATYASPQQAVYALKRGADGKLYAATGEQGVVYQIVPAQDSNNTVVARIMEPTQSQSLALALLDDNELLIGTGNNAAAYRLPLRSNATGSYTSTVFDAKNVVQWGAVRLLGQGAALEMRAGNTLEPDASWSAWKSVGQAGPGELQSGLPPARYAQYRLKLAQGEATTAAALANVARIEVVYRARNTAPEVLLTSPRGGEYWRGKQRLAWSGKDADNDPLRYRLWLSSNDGQTWQDVKGFDGEAGSYELDTTTLANGTYRVKVEATDTVRNPENPRRDESVSMPFVVDNQAPRLTTRVLAEAADQARPNAMRLTATIADDLSPITGIEWRWVRETVAIPATPTPATATPVTPATTPAGRIAPATPSPAPAKIGGPGGAPVAGVPPAVVAATALLADPSPVTAVVKVKPLPTPVISTKEEDWQALAAVDGIFDARLELVEAIIDKPAVVAEGPAMAAAPSAAGLPTAAGAPFVAGAPPAAGATPGRWKLELRLHDAAGNVSVEAITNGIPQ